VTVGLDKCGKVPINGNSVVIYAGACLLGNIKCGNNAVIGVNAAEISDITEGCTAVGVRVKY
jgi:serine O-acetyltransferase